MEWVDIEPGRVSLSLEPAEWMSNPLGVIHGGVTATLLDTVLGCALHTTLPAGTAYATADLHVRYLRPLFFGTGRLVATGEAVRAGSRLASVEGRIVVEESAKLIATATAGCAILAPA